MGVHVRQYGRIEEFDVVGRILVVLALVGASATASGKPDQVQELQKGMPKPVAELISRIVECNHWAGEEGYDAERRAEINKAISQLRCANLEKDVNVILRQYGSDPAVRRSIRAAKDLYL